MQKKTILLIAILVIALVVPALAIQIPGANRNAPGMVPVYDSGGYLIAYTLDLSQGVQVSETRVESIAKSKTGKPLWYLSTVKQGSGTGISEETITTPYPEDWDQSLIKFTYLEYVEYCIKYGCPKPGTFAINNRDGSWSKPLPPK
jgi:hypothetical protein